MGTFPFGESVPNGHFIFRFRLRRRGQCQGYFRLVGLLWHLLGHQLPLAIFYLFFSHVIV